MQNKAAFLPLHNWQIMSSLNVFEPIFRNYYIFGTQTDQQKQLKVFLCEVFFL